MEKGSWSGHIYLYYFYRKLFEEQAIVSAPKTLKMEVIHGWYILHCEEGDSRTPLTSEQHQAYHLAYKELIKDRKLPSSLHTA